MEAWPPAHAGVAQWAKRKGAYSLKREPIACLDDGTADSNILSETSPTCPRQFAIGLTTARKGLDAKLYTGCCLDPRASAMMTVYRSHAAIVGPVDTRDDAAGEISRDDSFER